MKILWIGFIWPEPNSSAAGARTMQLLNACLSVGHQIYFCSACQENVYQRHLEEIGISTHQFQANDPSIDPFIKQYSPDVVVFDRFMIEEQFGWRVREQCPNAIRILDTCDLHSLRRARQRKIEIDPSTADLTDSELQSDDAIREIASIYRSDLSLIISDFELRLLQERYKVPSEILNYCPLFYPTPKSVLGFDTRNNFVTIGNFNHPPNIDSYKLLRNELWPQIRGELTIRGVNNTELHIYGAYPSSEFLKFDDPKTGFRIKGWAEDLEDTLSHYRVNLAPLRFGAGLKGKIADGWRMGTPCVATTIAAEGMANGMEFGGAIEDKWDDFAKAAVDIYLQKARWEHTQKCGTRIISELFNEEINTVNFLKTLNQVIHTMDQRRSNNFVGQMLWHNHNRATEYFSRWITAKNRLTQLA